MAKVDDDDDDDDVPLIPMEEDVDRVVVVEAELMAELAGMAPFGNGPGWLEPDPGVAGGAGAELEFSSRSCWTCRMSTYSSRLAFGLVRVEIPAP